MKPNDIIALLCKKKCIKIGVLETKLGLNLGYFSRLDSFNKVKLVTMLELEKEFELDLHEIINYKPKMVTVEMNEIQYQQWLKTISGKNYYDICVDETEDKDKWTN